MELDKTRIPIRERSYLEVLDLALRVVREYAGPLLATSLLGAGPCILLNAWLLNGYLLPTDAPDFEWSLFLYGFWTVALVALEVPWASAPTTLYLGQALFLDRPDRRRMFRDFMTMLPQLLLFQLLLRGLLVLLCLTAPLMFWVSPYLTEVILLERNPLSRRPTGMSTGMRSKNLHAQGAGDFFARWMGSVLFGLLWGAAIWIAVFSLTATLTGKIDFSAQVLGINYYWGIVLPIAIWTVISYFNVVRYLSYLDLRIRNEGWEIELRMRAEAARIASQLG